jgi:hypothetical protein
MSQTKNTKKKNNFVVENPTILLKGLAKGVNVSEPVKQELTKASAMMVERKLARSKRTHNTTKNVS